MAKGATLCSGELSRGISSSFAGGWSIFDLGGGNSDAIISSGLSPGDGGGTLASRSAVADGEDEGPDRISYSYLEVLFVILENASVISLFFGVLLVILYQPH